MLEILERNKVVIETTNEQIRNYLTMSAEYLQGDYIGTSKNNNQSSQGITQTGANDVTPKMTIPEIESSKVAEDKTNTK